jgi:tetratricopeptide (TPR) repeat protein
MIPAALVGLLVLIGGWATWTAWRNSRLTSTHAPGPPRRVPARRNPTTESPFLNARPGVKYVGDAVCARCHADIARAFRHHPMGRSLAPIAAAPEAGIAADDRIRSFSAQGFEYAIERRGKRVFHRETRRDSRGREIARTEAEVQFVLGSGTRALSFLIDRDGSLFESPITWYTQQRRWDLAPGYETDNLHFERPIKVECLYCHANQVEAVAGTINRYREPIFQGHAIGCERCHGPGELHARRPPPGDDADSTIVNPSRLEPALREAVCQQCHLLGDLRIVRAGRERFDYRPGLPLHEFVSIFVKTGKTADNRFVGHVEQMDASRCFQASQGRLECISCHDPHRLPPPGEKAAYYRGRCLECHGAKGCGLPVAIRRERSRDDSCIACHMPRAASSNVPHTVTTVHRIPRFAEDSSAPAEGPPRPGTGGEGPLVLFHRELLDSEERRDVERDLGMALCNGGATLPGMTSPAMVGRAALPLLASGLARRPEDPDGWEAKGTALWMLGRRAEALAAVRTALEQAPDRETALVAAAARSAQLGRFDDALTDWRRTLAINPGRSDYHSALALALGQKGDWAAAAEACRTALALNSANLEARWLLVRCLFRLRQPQAARAEFDILLEFQPPRRDELLRWFDEQR